MEVAMISEEVLLIILVSVSLFLYCLIYCMVSLHGYHIFQLSSYNTREFLNFTLWRRWLNIDVIDALLSNFKILPRKAEKPLIYTPRMARMLVTHTVIMALIIIYSFSFSINIFSRLHFFLILFFLIPVFILLVNFINYPIEKAIGEPAPVSGADSWEKIDEKSGRVE